MYDFKKFFLIAAVGCLLVANGSIAADAQSQTVLPKTSHLAKPLQGARLAHDTGNPHWHGGRDNVSSGGRIRSYEYCSRTVFAPCMRSYQAQGVPYDERYRTCNRRHHLCTYGHLQNCIRGSTC